MVIILFPDFDVVVATMSLRICRAYTTAIPNALRQLEKDGTRVLRAVQQRVEMRNRFMANVGGARAER